MTGLNQRIGHDAGGSISTAPGYWSVSEHLWAERSKVISEVELGRIQATTAMIPLGVTTILDVGCGDGRITERFGDKYRVVGIDYAYNGVRQLSKKGVRASSASLPFPDKSFDLVLCCEVLEHLPDVVLKDTIRELERVSHKYILISVPYKENLRLSFTKCPMCQAIFHIYGHVRPFSNSDLDRLFANYEVNYTRYFGSRGPYYNGVICYLNQTLGKRWAADFDKVTVCSNCGNTSFPSTPRNLITLACEAVNLLASKLIPVSHRNWVLKLYSRTR